MDIVRFQIVALGILLNVFINVCVYKNNNDYLNLIVFSLSYNYRLTFKIINTSSHFAIKNSENPPQSRAMVKW